MSVCRYLNLENYICLHFNLSKVEIFIFAKTKNSNLSLLHNMSCDQDFEKSDVNFSWS